jgi:hypothetical protein
MWVHRLPTTHAGIICAPPAQQVDRGLVLHSSLSRWPSDSAALGFSSFCLRHFTGFRRCSCSTDPSCMHLSPEPHPLLLLSACLLDAEPLADSNIAASSHAPTATCAHTPFAIPTSRVSPSFLLPRSMPPAVPLLLFPSVRLFILLVSVRKRRLSGRPTGALATRDADKSRYRLY